MGHLPASFFCAQSERERERDCCGNPSSLLSLWSSSLCVSVCSSKGYSQNELQYKRAVPTTEEQDGVGQLWLLLLSLPRQRTGQGKVKKEVSLTVLTGESQATESVCTEVGWYNRECLLQSTASIAGAISSVHT